MNNGQIVFSQIMDYFPRRRFKSCVDRYRGDHRVKTFTCLDQFYCMTFAQLTGRESLRDIEACLRAAGPKLYHAGIKTRVSRTTLAKANEQRDWRIYRDIALILIDQARSLYANQPLASLYVLSLPADYHWVLGYASDWRWSPDSTQLLCTRQTPAERRARLWVVQRDGTSPTWLSIKGAHDHHGRWSPDGTAIAFLSHPEGSDESDHLWIMQANGMRRTQLTEVPAASPEWSADSKSIIFMKVTVGRVYDGLWLIKRDGSGLRELAANAAGLVGVYRTP